MIIYTKEHQHVHPQSIELSRMTASVLGKVCWLTFIIWPEIERKTAKQAKTCFSLHLKSAIVFLQILYR